MAFITKRLMFEKKHLNSKIQNGELDIVLHNQDADMTIMNMTIKGPVGSIYEGGTFGLLFNFDKQYPIEQPKVFFTTKIWNCNINYDDGAVCMETLSKGWTTAVKIERIIHSIYTLMLCPNPDSPFHPNIGAQYINNQEMYDDIGRYWTAVYAGGNGTFPDFEEKVKLLTNEKFAETKSREKLSIFNWDVDKAREMLMKAITENFNVNSVY